MRGQLSLEFVLLLMLGILAGTVAIVNLSHTGTNLNLSSDKAKSEIMGIFLGPGNGSIAVNIDNITITNENNQTINETTNINQTTINETTNETKLPDIVVSIEAYYKNGSLCCKGKHRVKNMDEDHQLRNRFGKCKDGENLTIKVYIWNNGSVNITKPFWVRIYTNDGRDLVNPIKIDKLNVGETKVIELNISVSKKGCECHRYRCGYLGNGDTVRYGEGWKGGCGCHISASTYQITVYADYNNTINESNEDNNIDSITLTVEKEHEKCCENSASLYIKFNGNSNGIITKSPIEGGEQISGPIEFRVKGNQVAKFNIVGEIYGDIIVNGNGWLYLGNVSYIKILDLKLNGNSNDKVDYAINVDKIDYLNANVINGNANLKLNGTEIDSFYVTRVNGNALLSISNAKIGTLKIDKINSNAEVDISNCNISSLTIGKIVGSGKVVILNSYINGKYYESYVIDENNYENFQ
ncbi:hypothetical protein [Methanocaldococcus sp.]